MDSRGTAAWYQVKVCNTLELLILLHIPSLSICSSHIPQYWPRRKQVIAILCMSLIILVAILGPVIVLSGHRILEWKIERSTEGLYSYIQIEKNKSKRKREMRIARID